MASPLEEAVVAMFKAISSHRSHLKNFELRVAKEAMRAGLELPPAIVAMVIQHDRKSANWDYYKIEGHYPSQITGALLG